MSGGVAWEGCGVKVRGDRVGFGLRVSSMIWADGIVSVWAANRVAGPISAPSKRAGPAELWLLFGWCLAARPGKGRGVVEEIVNW